MTTFEDRLARYNGLGPGFDFLRIGLAISIVAVHGFLLTGNPQYIRQTPFWISEYAFVPMFFALSGFLVAGSAMRLSLKNFLINRALRILPALTVDIVLCALIIGPLTTKLPLSRYFFQPDFFRYFTNITGWIHYNLPGVFKDHPTVQVNGALWTVPYEMVCYIIMSGLMLTKWIRRPGYIVAVAFCMLLIGFVLEHAGTYVPRTGVGGLFRAILVEDNSRLLVTFLIGIAMYQFKGMIPYNLWIFLACLITLILFALLFDKSRIGTVGNRFILLPIICYITAYVGLTPIPIPKIFHTGDYSYGIYLYHDPILQVIIGLVPGVILANVWGVIPLLAIGVPAVALLAAFSWHVVEKRILRLRKRFSFVARVRGVATERDAGVAPIEPKLDASF